MFRGSYSCTFGSLCRPTASHHTSKYINIILEFENNKMILNHYTCHGFIKSNIFLYERHFTYSAKAFPCTPRLNLKVSSCQCRHACYQLTILLPALPQLPGPVSTREQAVTSLWWQTQMGTKAPHLQHMVQVIQSLIFFFLSSPGADQICDMDV